MNVGLFKEQHAMFHIITDKTWDPTFVTKFIPWRGIIRNVS
jgi:hypothetical protein